MVKVQTPNKMIIACNNKICNLLPTSSYIVFFSPFVDDCYVLKVSTGKSFFFNVDIDECKYDKGGCNDTCVDTNGSFYCECNDVGYEVGEDGFSCIGMYIRVAGTIVIQCSHNRS